MLIISPWARRAVVHTTYDFTSVLKFIDEDFGMPILSRREQGANSIRNAFQFSHPLPRWRASMRDCPPVSAAQLAATGRNIDPN
jgi:phospholipase C